MNTAFGIPVLATGIFLFAAVALVVIGGLKRIAAITEKVVPFMVILYLIGSLIIIVMNIETIPAVFVSIFKGAFAMKSVGAVLSVTHAFHDSVNPGESIERRYETGSLISGKT